MRTAGRATRSSGLDTEDVKRDAATRGPSTRSIDNTETYLPDRRGAPRTCDDAGPPASDEDAAQAALDGVTVQR